MMPTHYNTGSAPPPPATDAIQPGKGLAGRLAALVVMGGFLLSPAHAQKVTAVPLDAAFNPAERALSMVKLSPPSSTALSSARRAAISSFQVEFVTKGAASASSYEIGRQGTANTNLVITLVGLGSPDYQAMTDHLYDGFVRDLTAMGIEVIPTPTILAAAAYQKMASSGKPSPAETRTKDTWSLVYAPVGMHVYGPGSSSTAVAMFAGFSAMSDVMSTLSGNVELSKELDASLVVVRMVVQFVDTKSSDSSWFGRSSGTASVTSSFMPSIAAGTSYMTVTSPTTSSTATLQTPLTVDGSVFKEIKDTSSIAANVGLALLSAAIGKGGSSSAVEKEAVADPEKYRATVGAGLGTVRSMFMARLRVAP
jgi:hypothetical protein